MPSQGRGAFTFTIGITNMHGTSPDTLRDGDRCAVVGGTHAGKTGIVRDMRTSRTGHVTITVEQSNGARFKTLLRNVVAKPDGDAA